MGNDIGILNSVINVDPFRLSGSRRGEIRQLLQTNWQSIIDDIDNNGIQLSDLFDGEKKAIPLLVAIPKFFTVSDSLRSIRKEIEIVYRNSKSADSYEDRDGAAKLLSYLKHGWQSSLSNRAKPTKKEQQILANKLESQKRRDKENSKVNYLKEKERKNKKYNEAKEWLSHGKLNYIFPHSTQKEFLQFERISNEINNVLTDLDLYSQLEFLEITKQHLYFLIQERVPNLPSSDFMARK